jgi:hypothetical protein
MRASIRMAAVVSTAFLVCPACKKDPPPEPVASPSDAGGDTMAEAKAVPRTDGYPDDFPSSIPSYPGATNVVAKKSQGLRLAPIWDVSFSTTDAPGQVALFYVQNIHGFQGSGTTSPSGQAESHWENATYHMDMYATPVVTPADAAAGSHVELSVTYTRRRLPAPSPSAPAASSQH